MASTEHQHQHQYQHPALARHRPICVLEAHPHLSLRLPVDDGVVPCLPVIRCPLSSLTPSWRHETAWAIRLHHPSHSGSVVPRGVSVVSVVSVVSMCTWYDGGSRVGARAEGRRPGGSAGARRAPEAPSYSRSSLYSIQYGIPAAAVEGRTTLQGDIGRALHRPSGTMEPQRASTALPLTQLLLFLCGGDSIMYRSTSCHPLPGSAWPGSSSDGR